jgi:tetratricopeptide (TPR) repeat protein
MNLTLCCTPDGGFKGLYLWATVFFCVLTCAMLPACSKTTQVESAPSSNVDGLISFYREKISRSSKHYPSYALLADALLKKARETGDPSLIVEARQNVEASLAIQPNYIALKTMAMICNYTHRFADAIEWTDKAAEASPEGLARDSELTAVFVEAYLGLGENEKAAGILEQLTTVGKKADDFYSASSRGAVLKAEEKIDEAVKAFEAAREFAARQGANSGVVWANVMAAGCLLDSGRTAEAEPYLKLARAMTPQDTVLRMHEAEFLLASKQPEEALRVYEELLKAADDAEVHRRAFVIARDLGDVAAANAHFNAAATGFEKVVAAGEIYTLGPLAQLYCDEGKDLERARGYALRNLEYKRDGEARDALRCVTEKTRVNRSR